MSKQELFGSQFEKWILEQGGSNPINRTKPSPSSIKTAVDLLRNGEVILIFPSGTRNVEVTAFKRSAATIALLAQVPMVPAFYQGPEHMRAADLMHRPRIRVDFGTPIPTAGLPIEKNLAFALTRRVQAAIEELRSIASFELTAA